MEESFSFHEGDVMVMIAPELGSFIYRLYASDWYDVLEDAETAIIMDETTILLKHAETIDTYAYPTSFSFNRDDVYGMIEYIYIFEAIYLVFAFLFSLMGYFLTALPVALGGMIMRSFMSQKLTFGQLYPLALYAKTLPHLIKGLLNLIGISFFGYSMIGFSIACVYLGFAIHHMDMLDDEQKKVEEPIIFD